MRPISNRAPAHRAKRALAASAVVAMGMTGLTACADSAGPEEGVTTEDLTSINDDVAALEDRIAELEAGMAVDPAAEEQPEVVGQEVTVSAEVSEVITSNDAGGAFRIAGDEGPSVAVLATTPPDDLDLNDIVQVTGTVVMVQRDTFEEDFGIAEDELFEDPDSFFEETEGQPAIAATEIDVIDAEE